MVSLPFDIHNIVIRYLTLWPTSDKPDVRSLGRLASTCRYFRDLIDINGTSPFICDPREKRRRVRIRHLRQNNPINDLIPALDESYSFKVGCHSYTTFEIYNKYREFLICSRFQSYVAMNPNITIEMLLEIIEMYKSTHANRAYELSFALSSKSVITMDELRRNGLFIDIPSSLRAITTQYYSQLPARRDFYTFESNGKIHPSDITKYNYNWHYDNLKYNENIPVEILFEWRCKWKIVRPSAGEIMRFCAGSTAQSVRTKYENLIMESYNYESGDFGQNDDHATNEPIANIITTCSKYFSFETINKYLNFPWKWDVISSQCGDSISIKHVINTPHLPWVWKRMNLVIHMYEFSEYAKYHEMYENGSLTIQTVIHAELEKPYEWNWNILAKYAHISIQDILKYKPSLVDYQFMYEISRRMDITVQIVLKHPEYKWYYYEILEKLNNDVS